MRFFLNIIFIIFISAARLLAQDINTGLVFVSKEKYENIPTAQLPIAAGQFPTKIDLSENMPPAGDQGQQNSCVAWSIAYACKSYQEKIKNNTTYTRNTTLDYSKIFSPSFVYNLINNGKNIGTSFEDACTILKSYGVCTWESMPYNSLDWTTKPNQNQIAEAKNHKIETYRKIELNNIVTNIKAELFADLPVIVATIVDESYYKNGYNTPNNPYIWSSSGTIDYRMGHAILIVGYDDTYRAFKFLNSYGRNWGNDGYGWISYDKATSVIREAYIIKTPLIPIEDSSTDNVLTQQTNDLNNYDKNNFGLFFNINNVIHQNTISNPTTSFQNLQMIIQGSFQIPNNLGRSLQIVVNFYLDNNGMKGQPIISSDYRYALATSQAATGTPKIQIPENTPVSAGWYASIPYIVLRIPHGQMTLWGYQAVTTNVIAEPVLFVDDFPVRVGQPIYFPVTY